MIRKPKRPGYEHARLSYDAGRVVDLLAEIADSASPRRIVELLADLTVAALLVWGKLGARQRRALVDLQVGVVVANPGIERAYPRAVKCSLVLRGMLTDRHDELWELSPLGAAVKLAGTRIEVAA